MTLVIALFIMLSLFFIYAVKRTGAPRGACLERAIAGPEAKRRPAARGARVQDSCSRRWLGRKGLKRLERGGLSVLQTLLKTVHVLRGDQLVRHPDVLLDLLLFRQLDRCLDRAIGLALGILEHRDREQAALDC